MKQWLAQGPTKPLEQQRAWAESTRSSAPSKQLWQGFQTINKYPMLIVHVTLSPFLEANKWPVPCVAVGLCWHSPVFRLTAVRDSGLSTTMQPGVAAVPSCWMSHCSHCTSSAAGLSQSTLPFLPDTAATKAQGDGSPGDKRGQRELPLHHPGAGTRPAPLPRQLSLPVSNWNWKRKDSPLWIRYLHPDRTC